MYRASTPTHEFTLPSWVMDILEDVRICYKQKDKEILLKTLKDCKVDGNTLSVELTQEETNLFGNGTTQVQMRVKTTDGKVTPTEIVNLAVINVLDDEVM